MQCPSAVKECGREAAALRFTEECKSLGQKCHLNLTARQHHILSADLSANHQDFCEELALTRVTLPPWLNTVCFSPVCLQ